MSKRRRRLPNIVLPYLGTGMGGMIRGRRAPPPPPLLLLMIKYFFRAHVRKVSFSHLPDSFFSVFRPEKYLTI